MSTEEKKEAAKSSFVKVSDKLPAVKSHSTVASSSVLLSLELEGGKVVQGQYQRWDRDMNAHHIQAKKGDGYFYGTDGAVLKDVTGWKKL